MNDHHGMDLAALRRVFTVTGEALSERYVALHDRAEDSFEVERWLDRAIELRDQRRGADHSDRETLLHFIGDWSNTLRDLDLMEEICGR
ncbi:hypothetical protein [Nocardiopsis aegyptia]|uniref:Uncharacterized protein n=1 Tax=Nocardiopsis aegyptia TaxID=220378 RepID=A0A7Z0EIK2_9ACTN|nr:hypothetical protein [Nocardiopsis aegyptia]NYJ32666.1 hypothetical protein [Nocardiopsis aegyptia]